MSDIVEEHSFFNTMSCNLPFPRRCLVRARLDKPGILEADLANAKDGRIN
ncbi:hypothetical protein V7O66_03290 [Methanolobus sp. ZRKC3]